MNDPQKSFGQHLRTKGRRQTKLLFLSIPLNVLTGFQQNTFEMYDNTAKQHLSLAVDSDVTAASQTVMNI